MDGFQGDYNYLAQIGMFTRWFKLSVSEDYKDGRPGWIEFKKITTTLAQLITMYGLEDSPASPLWIEDKKIF